MLKMKIAENTRKQKKKKELKFKEKVKKETRAKVVARKAAEKMTKERTKKRKEKDKKREERARKVKAKRAEQVKKARDKAARKRALERKSKAVEKSFKVKMLTPRLRGAKVHLLNKHLRVPAPDGTIMVGGGIINHYRRWNRHSGFVASYPDGNRWNCKTGFGKGSFSCYSLGYALPKGTRCINRQASTRNAGVVHATLPAGYQMVSGGLLNQYQNFNRLSVFEESMPSGNSRWRCDTGLGSGRLTCYVRGCKFPYGARCVTIRAHSNHAGWVWAGCPRGYRVTGCGAQNHYRAWHPRSGFEEVRPVGNKCLGDMGFGPGRVSIFARCCKVKGPPASVLMKRLNKVGKKAPPGSVKCMANAKWEKKERFNCVQAHKMKAYKKKPLSLCAFACARKRGCVAFRIFGKNNSCDLLSGRKSLQRSNPRNNCRGGKKQIGMTYFTRLPGGKCKSAVKRLLAKKPRRGRRL